MIGFNYGGFGLDGVLEEDLSIISNNIREFENRI